MTSIYYTPPGLKNYAACRTVRLTVSSCESGCGCRQSPVKGINKHTQARVDGDGSVGENNAHIIKNFRFDRNNINNLYKGL